MRPLHHRSTFGTLTLGALAVAGVVIGFSLS